MERCKGLCIFLAFMALCSPIGVYAGAAPSRSSTITFHTEIFSSAESAMQAFNVVADILIDAGWQDREAPQIGDESRLLVLNGADDVVRVTLLAVSGPTLVTVQGVSDQSDPTDTLIQIARAEIAGSLESPTATVTLTPTPSSEPTATSTVLPTVSGAGLTAEERRLTALLPEADSLPVAGLDMVEDSNLTQAAIAEALGGSRTAEQNLETWGWSGNATRSFSASDPAVLGRGATTNVVVSVHGFNSPESAQAALVYFSDVLANSGYTELQAPIMGDKVRLLRTTNEDGSMNVAFYATKGDVVYRIGASALAGGDPTDDVLKVAEMMFGATGGH